MYHEIVLTSLAYLGMTSIVDIERMTINEYFLRYEAYQLRQIKRNEELAYLAWLNQQVQATVGSAKKPKPKYRNFKQFFDSEKMVDEVRSSFELNYLQRKKIKDTKKANEQLFIKRLKEFKELKHKGLIKPWNERTDEERGGF